MKNGTYHKKQEYQNMLHFIRVTVPLCIFSNKYLILMIIVQCPAVGLANTENATNNSANRTVNKR